MDKEEKDMEQTNVDKLLSRIVYKVPVNSRMEEIGELLARKRTTIRRHETFRQRLVRWSIAASIAAIALIGGVVRFSTAEYTGGEQELACVLPDGSGVTLTPGSRLSYNKLTWAFRRRTALHGEAVFSVTRGRRFSVATPAGKVAVLGTRFRVCQQENDLLVECYEGSVSVEVPAGRLILQAGQQVRSDANGITLSNLEEPPPPYILFEAAPLKEVIRNIETIFGVTVSGKDRYGELVFTGYILTSDMDETLEAVFRSCGIAYETSGKEIILK